MKDEVVKESSANKELFIAYWQGYNKPGPAPVAPPALRDTPEYIDVVYTAFAVPGENSTIVTDCSVSRIGCITKENSQQSIIADTEILQSRNQKVVMSVNGNKNVLWESLDPKTFAKSVQLVAKEWKLDGIDLDNEVYKETPGATFVNTIKEIRDLIGDDFIISYPAYLPNRDGFLKEVKDELSWIMTMAYWNDYADAVSLFETYAEYMGSSEKVMMGIKPGVYGEDQSTPIEDVPKIVQYQPTSSGNNKAGVMMFSTTLDYVTYTQKPRFYWAEMIEKNLPIIK